MWSWIHSQCEFTIEDPEVPLLPAWKGIDTLNTVILNKVSGSQDTHKEARVKGPDGVTSYVMKKCAETLVNPLTMRFMVFLDKGDIPTQWKRPTVISI